MVIVILLSHSWAIQWFFSSEQLHPNLSWGRGWVMSYRLVLLLRILTRKPPRTAQGGGGETRRVVKVGTTRRRWRHRAIHLIYRFITDLFTSLRLRVLRSWSPLSSWSCSWSRLDFADIPRCCSNDCMKLWCRIISVLPMCRFIILN